jgi:hypothetical protein
MTTVMLDPRPESPEWTARPSSPLSQNPQGRERLVCEWKRTADGRMVCTWTLSGPSPAWVPALLPGDGFAYPPRAESRVHARGDAMAVTSQAPFPGWIRHRPRQVSTVLGLAAAILLLGLAGADTSRSTTTYSREPKQLSQDTTRVAVVRSPTMDNVHAAVIDPDVEFFLGAADGSARAWIRPPTLRFGSH